MVVCVCWFGSGHLQGAVSISQLDRIVDGNKRAKETKWAKKRNKKKRENKGKPK